MTGTAKPEAAQAEDMTSWALALFARVEHAPIPAPPRHERLEHMVEVLGLGTGGHRLLALFYGLWCGAGTQNPISAAQARRVVGGAAPHLRGLLVQWDILSEVAVAAGAPLALVLDETIGDWLEGGDPIPPRWRDRISQRAALGALPCWPIAKLVALAQKALAHPLGGPLVFTFSGAHGTGRHSLAAEVASALGTTPIFADLEGLTEQDALALVRLVERAAILSLRPPAYTGGEGLHLPAGQPCFALQFDMTATGKTGPHRHGADVHIEACGVLPMPDQAFAWARLCDGFSAWPAAEQNRLLHLKPATIGEIARISGRKPASASAAMVMIRQDQQARLNPAINPHRGRLGWSDIVLPARLLTALNRLTDEISLSPTLWGQAEMGRLFPQGRGVFALFSGPSGTGKTMAAQVIAASLEVDLYVVDTGALISKYVGETAQNLQNILAQAEADAAVLFFDEVDGIFGKRTSNSDTHARYLNSDTNVLLQAVEAYTGTCIMATNRRDNIDSAFLRRLRYVLEFPRPDAGLRCQLWQTLVQALAPQSAEVLAPNCQALAETLDFTGAQIKNAMRTATIEAMRAGRTGLTAQDLTAGAEHELMKEGRALTQAEAQRLGGVHA